METEGAASGPGKQPPPGEVRLEQTESPVRERSLLGEMMRNDCCNILWQYSGTCHTFIFART